MLIDNFLKEVVKQKASDFHLVADMPPHIRVNGDLRPLNKKLIGAKEIETYGVNQASSSEYFYEKAGVEYWLGMAVGRGVKVTEHGGKSELLTNKARFGGHILYGYNQPYDDIVNIKEKFGEPIVKKLFAPKKPKTRTVREVNQ